MTDQEVKRSILKAPKYGSGNVSSPELSEGRAKQERKEHEDQFSEEDDVDEHGRVKFRSVRSLASIKIMSERGNRVYDDWPDVSFFLRYWDIGFSQASSLTILRDRLQDVKDPLNRPGVVVRFLISNKFQIGNAEKQFRDMILWRHQSQACQHGYVPPVELLEKYPSAILKANDKEGDPIFVSRLGITDLAGLMKAHGTDEIQKYEVFRRESIMGGAWQKEWSTKAGRPFRDVLVIEDLASKGSSKMPFFGTTDLDQEFYPELAKDIIIIRASTKFRAAWSLAKRSIPKSIREKIVVCGTSDYLKVLEEYVDLEVLPPCINPQGKGELLEGMSINLEGSN